MLDPKMEESSIIRRALRAADHAVHRRRHGLPLFGEEVRRVVSSDRRHISCYSLQAPARRRRWRRGGLARAEPVEEGSHLSSAACDLSCSPTRFFGRAARLRDDGCLVMLMLSSVTGCSPGPGRLSDGRSDEAGTRRCRGVPQASMGQARRLDWLQSGLELFFSALQSARSARINRADPTAATLYAAPAPDTARSQQPRCRRASSSARAVRQS